MRALKAGAEGRDGGEEACGEDEAKCGQCCWVNEGCCADAEREGPRHEAREDEHGDMAFESTARQWLGLGRIGWGGLGHAGESVELWGGVCKSDIGFDWR